MWCCNFGEQCNDGKAENFNVIINNLLNQIFKLVCISAYYAVIRLSAFISNRQASNSYARTLII